MNRVVSLIALFALILLLGSTFYRVISPFLLPLFLAAILAVICQPLQSFFLKKTGGRTAWAAGLTTGTVTLIIVGPMVIGTFIAASSLYGLADQHLGKDWIGGLDSLWQQVVMPALERVSPFIPGGLSTERIQKLQAEFTENIRSLAAQVAGTTLTIASSTVGMFVSLAVAGGMFLTALYYFLADGPAILCAAEELIPVPVDHQRKLRDRFARVVRAVVTATFIAAFAQGLATALALQAVGLQHFLIFLVIGTIASLIPLAGAWMVWGPCAVWLAIHGHWMAAMALTAWGLIVVSMLDNIVKMYVLQSEADLHPLIAFISVIGALQVMGLWGVFVGPIVASCLFALIQIFNAELKEMVNERDAMAANSASTALTPAVVAVAPLPIASPSPANAIRPAAAVKQGRKRRR